MSETITEKKESPAQRVERVKRERAPWSILDEIKRYAQTGFDSIPDEDLNIRFRAWGIYTQGDGLGTRGGAVPYFMMRVRTPNGVLTSQMVHKIADLSTRYARGTVDITNRQNFQFHWLRIEDIPTIWEELQSVGIHSMGSCGDNTRTITGCPLAGVEGDELIDASDIAVQYDTFFNGNPEFANLPRKYKITITGCTHWCTYPEINDVGLTAVRRRKADGQDEIGYSIRVAGGLSTRPHMAIKLNAFVRQDQALEVMKTITAIFRDSDELRKNRAKARMKFLFINFGWNTDSFLNEINRRLGYNLDPAVPDEEPQDAYRDHVGINPQKQKGLNYAGFSVTSGRTSPEALHKLADLAAKYGKGRLRNTAMQNIIVLDIPDDKVEAFACEAVEVGHPLKGSPFQRGTLSCTGSQFCKLAVAETKQFSIQLVDDLNTRFPGFTDALKINIAGCPNACGQHLIADIGLQGVQLKNGDESVDGFDFFIGGGLGANAAFARRLGFRAPASEVPARLHRLLLGYIAEREEGERVGHWANRVGDAWVKRVLGEGVCPE